MKKMDIGVYGLAVMGRNLALNIESRGYKVSVYNRTTSKMEKFLEQIPEGKNIHGEAELKDFVNSLSRPRKIILMVKAGKPVDLTIDKILPYLDKGDILVDGGNSHYLDTRRRTEFLDKMGLLYIGMGVSGGEEGARYGPSLMPGGNKKAYDQIEDLLDKIAAKAEGIPCSAYIGPKDAGHFVKIVHNGIEYADMQLIAESYDFLRNGMTLPQKEIQIVFDKWSRGPLNSYLMDITTDILGAEDKETGKPMLNIIQDRAKQKGTGKWTSQAAMDIGVPVPAIDAAVSARIISAYKQERTDASRVLQGPDNKFTADKHEMIDVVRDAMYCSKISAYAQGFALLRQASNEFDYQLKLNEIAQIWKAGCIIRAKLLEPVKQAFERNPDLKNLYMDAYFLNTILKRQHSWRRFITESVRLGIPTPAASASLNYFDSYRRATLPANLIQAQRDYFGSHTFERIDKEGAFHREWKKMEKEPA